MFYMIKHIPTDTWVPQLKSSRERSHYYSFLEGKIVTTAPIFNKKILNFKKGFKYKEKELATIFIDKMPIKLKLSDKTDRQIKDMFVVEEFEKYPVSELHLCRTHEEQKHFTNRFTMANTKVEQVSENWFGYSDTYCTVCGALIQPGVKYLRTSAVLICNFCLEETLDIIHQSTENCDQELLEDIQTARFVNRI